MQPLQFKNIRACFLFTTIQKRKKKKKIRRKMQIVLSNQHTRFMSQFYLWLHLPDKEELSATKVNQRTSNIPCKFPEKPQSWYQVNML